MTIVQRRKLRISAASSYNDGYHSFTDHRTISENTDYYRKWGLKNKATSKVTVVKHLYILTG